MRHGLTSILQSLHTERFPISGCWWTSLVSVTTVKPYVCLATLRGLLTDLPESHHELTLYSKSQKTFSFYSLTSHGKFLLVPSMYLPQSNSPSSLFHPGGRSVCKLGGVCGEVREGKSQPRVEKGNLSSTQVRVGETSPWAALPEPDIPSRGLTGLGRINLLSVFFFNLWKILFVCLNVCFYQMTQKRRIFTI